uniref:hypothetical protein n=1 Tax=Streptomyces bicolor TaxID=66874 RepID=UPI001FD58ED8
MPGTVLLLAAAPAGKGCLVDAASVLPVLAAVPPAVLSGTDTANVVELADPLEPQAVLTRLRAAAAAHTPLTVFVTGQLQLDRRQHLPHLALARTTPATVRYTGFPWHWIREELRLRAPGSTSLVLDLHADAETWEWLRANPLDSGRNNAVHGRIAPPPSRRTVAVPTYMKAIATILRSGHRPPLDQLHQQALTRISPDGGVGTDIVLTAHGPTQFPSRDLTRLPAPAPVPGHAPAQVPGQAQAQAQAQAPAHPVPQRLTAGPVPAAPPTQVMPQRPALSPTQAPAQSAAPAPAQIRPYEPQPVQNPGRVPAEVQPQCPSESPAAGAPGQSPVQVLPQQSAPLPAEVPPHQPAQGPPRLPARLPAGFLPQHPSESPAQNPGQDRTRIPAPASPPMPAHNPPPSLSPAPSPAPTPPQRPAQPPTQPQT